MFQYDCNLLALVDNINHELNWLHSTSIDLLEKQSMKRNSFYNDWYTIKNQLIEPQKSKFSLETHLGGHLQGTLIVSITLLRGLPLSLAGNLVANFL